MAGHSKFKNIMHRKGRADAVRSKLFSKLSREITVAAKSGMPDPNMNARLRLAVANAKAESMPKDNIDRAIKKAFPASTVPVEMLSNATGIPDLQRWLNTGSVRKLRPSSCTKKELCPAQVACTASGGGAPSAAQSTGSQGKAAAQSAGVGRGTRSK